MKEGDKAKRPATIEEYDVMIATYEQDVLRVQLAVVSLRRGRSQVFPSLILRFTNPKWD